MRWIAVLWALASGVGAAGASETARGTKAPLPPPISTAPWICGEEITERDSDALRIGHVIDRQGRVWRYGDGGESAKTASRWREKDSLVATAEEWSKRFEGATLTGKRIGLDEIQSHLPLIGKAGKVTPIAGKPPRVLMLFPTTILYCLMQDEVPGAYREVLLDQRGMEPRTNPSPAARELIDWFQPYFSIRHACAEGFVHRLAQPADLVCVPPQAHERTVRENKDAALRVDPQGAYGANSCKAGYVWRVAFEGDLVCVTPAVRSIVAEENRLGSTRLLESASPVIDEDKGKANPALPFVPLQTREENGWTILDETCARRISASNGDQVHALGCERATSAGYVRRRLFNVDGQWMKADALDGLGEDIAIVGNGDGVTVTTDGRLFELANTGWGKTRLDGCMRRAAVFGDGLVALSCSEVPSGGHGIVVRDREITCMITDRPGGGCSTQDFGQKTIVGGAAWLAVDREGDQLWALSGDGTIRRTRVKGACRGPGAICQLGWTRIPGCARRVAVQQSDAAPSWGGGPQVWALGCAQRDGGGFDVLRWRNGAWEKINGAATEISVGSESVFILDPKGRVLRRVLSSGVGVAGAAEVVAAPKGPWLCGQETTDAVAKTRIGNVIDRQGRVWQYGLGGKASAGPPYRWQVKDAPVATADELSQRYATATPTGRSVAGADIASHLPLIEEAAKTEAIVSDHRDAMTRGTAMLYCLIQDKAPGSYREIVLEQRGTLVRTNPSAAARQLIAWFQPYFLPVD